MRQWEDKGISDYHFMSYISHRTKDRVVIGKGNILDITLHNFPEDKVLGNYRTWKNYITLHHFP